MVQLEDASRRANGGNYINYGVREFGMSAIMNGIALHGGFIPYGGTFLIFSDYARNALRMAALMKIRNIFVFTHDSIGLGEDGPTHQSVEQAATLRLIPNMDVWRPCDTRRIVGCVASAIERNDGPSALLFSRQNIAIPEARCSHACQCSARWLRAPRSGRRQSAGRSSSPPAPKCRLQCRRSKP